jgi:hypothetical protein
VGGSRSQGPDARNGDQTVQSEHGKGANAFMYYVKTHIDWAKEESDCEFATAYAKLVAYWKLLEYGCPAEEARATWGRRVTRFGSSWPRWMRGRRRSRPKRQSDYASLVPLQLRGSKEYNKLPW